MGAHFGSTLQEFLLSSDGNFVEFSAYHTPVFGGTMPNMFPVYYGGSHQDCFYIKSNRSKTPDRCGRDNLFPLFHSTAVSTTDSDFPFSMSSSRSTSKLL